MSVALSELKTLLNTFDPALLDESLESLQHPHSYKGLPKTQYVKELILGYPTKKEQWHSWLGPFTPGQLMQITKDLGPLMVQKRGSLAEYVEDGGETIPIWSMEQINRENTARKFTYGIEERVGMCLHTLVNKTSFANVATIYG